MHKLIKLYLALGLSYVFDIVRDAQTFSSARYIGQWTEASK
jgi:hypothetical protein